jgi:hypothetical protein
MHLNATIALDGLSTLETEVDDVIERIRSFLHRIDPNADVGIELLAVGADFGASFTPVHQRPPLNSLLDMAQQRRNALLHAYWRNRDRRLLNLSLRLAHVAATMDAARICQMIDDIEAMEH